MAETNLQIKISVEAQLQQLRAMEAQFARQIVQLRTLGDTSGHALPALEKNLALVRKQLEGIGFAQKAGVGLGDMVKDIPVVGAAMSAMNGSALPTAAAFGAATFAVNQFFTALNQANQLQDSAEQMDVTTSSLQALGAHFGDAGIRGEQVAQTLLRLRQSLADAAAGSVPLQAAFAALNLNADELRRLSIDEAFARVGRALGEMAGDARAAAAANDILGRVTGRMTNSLVELGARGLPALKQELKAAGRLIEDEQTKRLADASIAWERLKDKIANYRNEMAAALLMPSDPERMRQGVAADDKRRTDELATLSRPSSLGDVPANRARLQGLLEEARQPLPQDAYARLDSAQADALDAKLAARVALIQKAQAELEARAVALKTEAELAKQQAEAPERAKIAQDQAALDEKMLAWHTSTLPLADQITVAEAERARLRSQMPAEDDKSLAAERAKVEIGAKLQAQAELLAALKKQQAADDEKARADDEDWLERTYAADAERIALRKKERDQQRDQALSRGLGAGDEAVSRLDSAKGLTDEQKARGRATILAQENKLIAERIGLLEKQQADETDSTALLTRQAQIDSLRQKQGKNAAEIDALKPLTASEGAMAGLVGYINSIPDMAARAQQAIMGIAQAMENGIATSLEGLINRTMTWGQALANIGTSIVQSIIGSFVRMAAQWITQQIIMALFGNAIRAAQLAAIAPVAAASAALWAPAATAASIATLGSAAVEGATMAKTAIVSSALGLATGGAVIGPGTSTSDSILARLSNGEHVIDAATVRRFGGHGFFDDLREGRMPLLAAGAPATGGGGSGGGAAPSVSMHQAFFFDREEAMRSALNSPAGRRLFVDLLRSTQHEI